MKPFVLTAIALLLAFAALAATSATDVRSGVWTADIKDNRVQMMIFTGGRDGRHNMGNNMGFALPLARFDGPLPADGEAKFSMHAAAGLISFDGHFSDAKGAGHFTFTPSEPFVREMESLGYTNFRDDELLMFATTDFNPANVRGLRSIGYDIRQHDLDEIAVFHITPDVVREYERAGYPNLPLRNVVDFRVGRVDAAYINAIRQQGYGNLSARELSEFGIQHVTPEYIESLRKAGYDHLSPRQLVEMRIFRVDPEYIKAMTAIGVTDLHKMVELRQTGAADILLKKKSR